MNGIVAIMDVLGVSNFNIKECYEFLEYRDKILIPGLEQHSRLFGTLDENKGFKHGTDKYGRPLKERYYAIFGDTVIIWWPIGSNDESRCFYKIGNISYELNFIMHSGFEHKYLFRGCISVGESVFREDRDHGNSILGPAISDAHDWYGLTDWFGIIFSPKTRLWVEYLLKHVTRKASGDLKTFNKIIIPYDVPLTHRKGEKSKKFLTVAWPYWYYHEARNYYKLKKPDRIEETPRESFLKDLFEISQSKEGESKFNHSIEFFDWYSNFIQQMTETSLSSHDDMMDRS